MTAVEWLCNEWLYLDQQFDMCLIDRNIYWDKLRQIQEQAKKMENQQMNSNKCYHPLTERKHTSDTYFECTICGYNNY